VDESIPLDPHIRVARGRNSTKYKQKKSEGLASRRRIPSIGLIGG